MHHTIRYVNNRGDEIDFTGPFPYRMVTGDLFNYSWSYNRSEDYRNRGAKITSFKRNLAEHSIEVDVFAATEELYINAINDLCDITDYDVQLLRPGRLYVDGSYLDCYMIASSKEQWESPALYLQNMLTLVAEYPIWWCERFFSFGVIDVSDSEEDDDFTLADAVGADFPYDFANDATLRMIDNSGAYRGSEFILRIYGPAHNPSITAGEALYSVETDLEINEVLEINSYMRTIVKRNTISGVSQNCFGSRSRDNDIFARIPSGHISLYYSGDFAFDLVLLEDRSEPLWTS